jgi:hypothetical protein
MMKAGPDWRNASRRYSRANLSSLSRKLCKGTLWNKKVGSSSAYILTTLVGNVKAVLLGLEDSRNTRPHTPVACLTKFIKQQPARTLWHCLLYWKEKYLIPRIHDHDLDIDRCKGSASIHTIYQNLTFTTVSNWKKVILNPLISRIRYRPMIRERSIRCREKSTYIWPHHNLALKWNS